MNEKRPMKATSSRAGGLRQIIQIRQHRLYADEPTDQGGDDSGPSPEEMLAASLASCTAITMEMYAKRKGWDVGEVEVVVDYAPPTAATRPASTSSCASPRASAPSRSSACA